MILHVDMDAFYASVEEREQPELRGKPVIVGGTPEGRGVVSAANYEARKFGVHSALPASTAKRLCPHGIFLRTRIDFYARVSQQIREIFDRFTPLVEPLSLDEAFLDVSGSTRLFGSPVEIGRQVQNTIQEELQLVASVGIAPNKFLAKIASDLDKPNGFVIVDPDQVQKFLDPLPVSRLWGVGKVSIRIFQRLGIETIGQLRNLTDELLKNHFGERTGEHLWRLAHGIDNRSVVPDQEAKSISHETTFAVDVTEMDLLRTWLLDQTEQVAARLRRSHLKGRTVQLKLRYDDFTTITRSLTLPIPTDVTHEIWEAAADLLSTRLPARRLSVRLLGMGVTGLQRSGTTTQQLLFDGEEREKQSRLDTVTDEIRQRFGKSAVGRGLKVDQKSEKETDR